MDNECEVCGRDYEGWDLYGCADCGRTLCERHYGDPSFDACRECQPGEQRSDNTVADAATQTMRCLVCGDEVPIPFGAMEWVTAVMDAFCKAHAEPNHAGPRTWFSQPVGQGQKGR